MSCCREQKRIIAHLRAVGLSTEARAIEKITAKEWQNLPKGWTEKSLKSFWDSLTGDRVHKVTACIKKMTGKVDDPGAFFGGLASRLGLR